jgi:putative intracellular protease/amidase
VQIAVPLFERLTALDAIGPYEVLSRLPGAEVVFVAAEPGPKRTDTGALSLAAERSLGEVPDPDVVVVPGGRGTRDQPHEELVAWIQQVHQTTRWTTSVCTGALLLGEAGILDGLRATTH